MLVAKIRRIETLKPRTIVSGVYSFELIKRLFVVRRLT